MTDDQVTLREYFEARLQGMSQAEAISLRELIEARLQALALAVEKQENAYNLRFEGLNEWRQTYADLVSKAVTRDVFDAFAADYERRLADNRAEYDRRLSTIEAKQANFDGRIVGISAGISFIALVISLIIRFTG